MKCFPRKLWSTYRIRKWRSKAVVQQRKTLQQIAQRANNPSRQKELMMERSDLRFCLCDTDSS